MFLFAVLVNDICSKSTANVQLIFASLFIYSNLATFLRSFPFVMSIAFWLCIVLVTAVACCSGHTTFSEASAHNDYAGADIVSLSIPRPLGFLITNEFNKHTNRNERVCHLQHNSLSLRKEWSQVATVNKVVSSIESNMIVSVAVEQSSNWFRTADDNKVALLPLQEIFPEQMAGDISNVILRALMPTYADTYRVNSSAFYVSDLHIKKQSMIDVSEDIPMLNHSRVTPWVFEIALNSDYEGGGLYFTGTRQVFNAKLGDALLYNAMNPCTGKL